MSPALLTYAAHNGAFLHTDSPMLSGTRGTAQPADPPLTATWRKRDLWVAAFFALLTVLHTWPLARASFVQTTPGNDTLMNVWALRELTHQLLTDPLNLLDGNAFHPYSENTVALVDHMFTNALLVAPLWLMTEHSLFIYNIGVLATFALSGFFTYKLVETVSGSRMAGLIAGVAFAFSTMRWEQVGHIHAASTQFLPLGLLTLHGVLAHPTRRRLAAFTAAALLVALSSWHVALFGVFSLGIIALWTLIGDGRAIGRRMGMLMAAALVVLIALIPFIVAYIDAARAWRPVYSEAERLHELNSHSLRLEALIAAGTAARAPYAPALSVLGDSEWRGFPGVVTTALALLALLNLRGGARGTRFHHALLIAIGLGAGLLALGVMLARQGQPALASALAQAAPVPILSVALLVVGLLAAQRTGRTSEGVDPRAGSLRLVTLGYFAIAVFGALLSLGPTIHAGGVDLGPGIYLEDWLPMLSLLRSPGRFVMLVALGSAVLAGFGVRTLADRLPRRAGGVALVVVFLLLNLDLRVAPIGLVDSPRANRGVHHWLLRASEPGSVVEYPLGRSLWWMYLSPAHGRPLVNGSGYIRPPMFDALTGPPDLSRAQLEMLWEHFHPRFAIVRGWFYSHKPDAYREMLAAVASHPAAVTERARFGDDFIFELTDTGSGPALYRRWPQDILARAGTLTFLGRVSGRGDDAVTALEVDLNGRTVLHAEGAAAEEWSQHTIVYDPAWLVPGINTFEIRSDYRLTGDVPARTIGTTGGTVRADVAISSTRDRSWLQVNGRVFAVDKGYALAVLDAESGAVRSFETFNTSWYPEDSHRLARFIAGIPDGSPVLVSSEFDVSRSLTEEAVAALKTLGLKEDMRGHVNVLHAAVGVKGAAPGTALESTHPESATLAVGGTRTLSVELNGLELLKRAESERATGQARVSGAAEDRQSSLLQHVRSLPIVPPHR